MNDVRQTSIAPLSAITLMKLVRHLIIYGLVAMGCAASAFACSQAPDKISVEGVLYPLFTNPLEQLYESQERPVFVESLEGSSTANWRGYVASWEIHEGRLYLIAIDTYVRKQKVGIVELFPGQVGHGRILAEWFSGELRIPDGERLQGVNMGYASTYERDIIFEVRNGQVISHTVIDNRNKPLPNEWERGAEEERKMVEWRKKTKQRP